MSTESSTPFALGVFVGNANISDPSAEASFDAANEGFDSLMGATPTFQNVYVDASQAPSNWLNDAQWFASSAGASPTWKGEIPTIGLPMGSSNSGAPSAEQILQNYADGSYDSMLQGMVKAWANSGFMTQYWRPGVEMNLSSTPGFVGSSSSMQQLWISAFQHIYTTLHAAAQADGVSLKVIWNPGITNDSVAGNATQTLYPGNQYVDIIGADVYSDIYTFSLYDWDKSGQEINSPHPVYDSSLQQWASDPINLAHYYTDPASNQYSLDATNGNCLSMQGLIDFAKAQGKPICVCETGAGATGDGAGLSDNPVFVQWLSSTLENSGVTVDYVNIWDSDGGGNYAFSSAGDGKPQEAAAWAKYFGAQSTTSAAKPITITPATESVATTDTSSVTPFKGVVITDANGGQTETAIVTLSSVANGTLSDPNAATDGSTSAAGVWSVSGSAAAVAADLDDLVFKPAANQVPAGVTVTTTFTVSLGDTAGKTTTATATVNAKQTGESHGVSASGTQINGTSGTIYDTSGDAWTINNAQKIVEDGTVVPSSAGVVTLFWTGTALDQLNNSGEWWTQPLDGSAGTELSGPPPGYDTSAVSITVTPSDGAAATTDAASAKPFTDVAIVDPNSGQIETATVSLSATANGTLSDPNAASDGSEIVDGVLTVSGSVTAVANALDGLVFTPTKNQVAPTSVVTTTVTASIKDTAGETASTVSVVKATDVAAAISITPATETVATTDTASAKPFAGVAINDPNAGQTETATVSLSSTANGTLSDANAATDDSTVANGVWTVSGSAAAVASALDGLTFKPTANQVAAGAVVTTTVSAAIKDTAGETASAVSKVTATEGDTSSSSSDTLALNISEDAWKGNAEFTVSVNGKQVGGDYAVSTLHASGDAGTVLLTGDWGSGVNDVQVSFINDAYGGNSSEDRNLYVNSVAYNGVSYAGTTASLFGNSTDAFAVGGTTPTTSAPADTLTLNLSEDEWSGNAEFVLYIDGKAVTTPQVVTALHDAKATQSFSFTGNFGTGAHTIGVAYVNDSFGGKANEDRNLYINGVSINGSSVFSGAKEELSNGTSLFTLTTAH